MSKLTLASVWNFISGFPVEQETEAKIDPTCAGTNPSLKEMHVGKDCQWLAWRTWVGIVLFFTLIPYSNLLLEFSLLQP
jgi:hypothetical protein